MDLVSFKLALLNSAPAFVRRRVMARRFEEEIHRTGEAEMALLGDFLRPGDLALDIGANLGGYAYALAKHCGRVIAFEPNPALAGALTGLGFPGVEVRHAAVADKTGEAVLHLPGGREHVLASLKPAVVAGSAVQCITVPLVNLDGLDLPHVAFIKIDVEGAEEDVITGAERLIKRDRPTLLVEIEERHNPGGLERIANKLAALNYDGRYYLGGWHPLASFVPETHQNVRDLVPGTSSTRRGNHYINNFLFVPRVA